MISDTLRLTPRLQRCLDAIERINGRIASREYLAAAMYPPPADEPTEFDTLLKVTVCHLRKRMAQAKTGQRIENVRGKGYRLAATSETARLRLGLMV